MSIKIMSPNIVYLGAAKAPSGSNEPTTVNLNYIQDTAPSNPQEKEVWYNTSDNKIYTYKNGQWTETGEATVGVWYYDTVNDKYYLWDGTSLEETELNIYEKIENKTDNFESTSSITYPSSKALSDGLQDTLDKSYKPNLFDIKTISEPTAQKGWSCISYPTQNKLDKDKVPTIYNELNIKLNNVNLAVTGWQTGNKGSNVLGFYNEGDNCWYYTSSSSNKIYKVSDLSFSSPTTVVNSTGLSASGGNLLIKAQMNLKTVYILTAQFGYKIFDTSWTVIDSGSFSFDTNVYAKNYVVTADKNKVFINYNAGDVSTNRKARIVVFDFNEDIPTKNIIEYDKINNGESSSRYASAQNLVYYNGFVYGASTIKYIKINVDDYSYIIGNVYSDQNNVISTNNGYLGQGSHAYLVINTDTNKLIFICYATLASGSSSGSWNINGCLDSIWEYKDDGNWKQIYYYTSGTNNKISIETVSVYYKGLYYIAFNRNNTRSVDTTKDFINFTTFYNYSGNILKAILFYNSNYVALPRTDSTIYYTGLSKTVYTDTINGIDIKYYKNDDMKICTPDIAVGNDDNLQSVYEYLGYLNYWWIDTTNEQITLQRNSNLWTMMYVGDDYEDVSLSSGNYRKNKLVNELIEDDSASITIDIKGNQFYKFTNNAITDITIDSCEDSIEETVIKFTTGSSAPTLTDNASLVWYNGIPTLLANTSYTIVIVDKTAYYQEN